MYFAVPVFFMISGATLIEYRERYTTKEYFKKRIVKTVIPFLAWSVIGLFYRTLTNTLSIDFSIEGIKNVVVQILNGQIIGIYWFFPAIFGIYLCIPLFSAVNKELREKLFAFLITVSLVLNYVLPFFCSVWPSIGYANNIPFWIVNDYLIYVLIGYLISKKDISARIRCLSYIAGVAGLLLHICGTYFCSVEAGSIIQTYKGYSNLPCLLYSVGIFIFIKQLGMQIKEKKLIKGIEILSKYTFAVYLMHWFAMDIFVRITSVSTLSIIYRVDGALLIFITCVIITFFVRKIPGIKRIVPS